MSSSPPLRYPLRSRRISLPKDLTFLSPSLRQSLLIPALEIIRRVYNEDTQLADRKMKGLDPVSVGVA